MVWVQTRDEAWEKLIRALQKVKHRGWINPRLPTCQTTMLRRLALALGYREGGNVAVSGRVSERGADLAGAVHRVNGLPLGLPRSAGRVDVHEDRGRARWGAVGHRCRGVGPLVGRGGAALQRDGDLDRLRALTTGDLHDAGDRLSVDDRLAGAGMLQSNSLVLAA